VNSINNFQVLDIIEHPDSTCSDTDNIVPGNAYAYSLIAVDSAGNQSDFSDTVQVGLPVINWQLTQIRNNQATYVPFGDFLYDPDHSPGELTLSFMNTNNVFLQISNRNLIISPDPYNYAGQCSFDLEVRDPNGFWDIRTIQMSVLQTAPASMRPLNHALPSEYELSQNYPNPFNPSTTIQFAIPVRSVVKIDLYNTLGEKVQQLLYDQAGPGYFEFSFNAQDLSAGSYFLILSSDDVRLVRRILLIK